MKALEIATVPIEPGVTLIEASAGTGKTYSIAALFLRLVIGEGLPIERILCVTYTKAATQELQERIRRRLYEARQALRQQECGGDPVVATYLEDGGDALAAVRKLELALQSFDEAAIFTIHGFCQRTLQEYAFESGARYGSETLEDQDGLCHEVTADFWRRTFYEASPLLNALATGWEISYEPWLNLLKRTRNHPLVRVIPEPEGSTLAELTAALESTYSTLVSRWNQGGDTIRETLLTSKALRRVKGEYRADATEELLEHLARLANPEPDPVALMALRRSSASALGEATKAKYDTPTHPFFEACESFCTVAERLFMRLQGDFLSYAEAELARRKGQQMSYDDLLTHLHRALTGPGGSVLTRLLQERYALALVDEFQDTDPVQAEIFERVFASERLFLIGDPKQAIYGFRGADVFTYLKSAANAERRYNLGTNWRSDPTLLQAFNHLFGQVAAPFVLSQIAYHPVDAPPGKAQGMKAPLTLRYLQEPPTNQQQRQRFVAQAVADDIARLLAKEEAVPGEIAVLVRYNKQAVEVAQWLRRRKIPCVLKTQDDVFHSPEAEMLALLLRAVAEPRNEAAGRTALTTPLFSFDAARLVALEQDDLRREGWIERFSAWHLAWQEDGFIAMFRRVLSEEPIRSRLLQGADGERAVTNLLHLGELLHQEATARRLAPEALLHWFSEQQRAGNTPGEAAELRLESDAAAVQIVTIHRSKGLEYPVVFCPFLWEPPGKNGRSNPAKGPISYHGEDGALCLDLRGKAIPQESFELAEQEALAEEMRLLYVAVTRAKHRCILYGGDIGKGELSALGTLLGLEAAREGEAPMYDAFANLTTRYPEAFGLLVDEAMPVPPVPETSSGSALREARLFRGTIRRTPLLTSFTALVARSHGEAPELSDPPATEEPAPAELTPIEEDVVAPIFAFDKGVRAGDFFHAVLERLDFQKPETIPPLVSEQLTLHGFGASPFANALEATLRGVLEAELLPGLQLATVPMAARLSEVDFLAHLPSFGPTELRALYTENPSPSIGPEELARLDFKPVKGFLRGVIDLLFLHEGRYYLLDWKSNWLGNQPADYGPEGLRTAMHQHFYGLQAHLYVAAVDRFLQNRLPGYDYEHHFGGFLYLFLRGVDPGRPGCGVWHEKPPLALITQWREQLATP